MRGIIYGTGVGPGDPELMTLKAVRLIRENRYIALPAEKPRESLAYRIAVQAVPELAEKELVAVDMPMVRDRAKLRAAHEAGARQLMALADRGENVVFLTLGDPTVYCTFSYLQHILEAEGYPVELVSGIPSFCAAAARLSLPLGEWDEPIHILPAAHKTGDKLDQEGSYVLMKSASHMREVKDMLAASGRKVQAVIDCGLPTEQLCRSLEDIPDDASYFSLIIAKE